MRLLRFGFIVLIVVTLCIGMGIYRGRRIRQQVGLCSLDSISGFNLADLSESEPLIIRLKNNSSIPIQIKALQPSCSCTSAVIDDLILKPNKTTKLRVAINRLVTGKIDVSLAIQYEMNRSNLELIIPVKGWNLPNGYLYIPDRGGLIFGTVLKGALVKKHITVYGLKNTLRHISAFSGSARVSTSIGSLKTINSESSTIGAIEIGVEGKLDSASTKQDAINVSSETMNVRIPVIWDVEELKHQTSLSVFLGRVEADEGALSSVTFPKAGAFSVAESKNARVEIIDQEISDNTTKLKLKIVPLDHRKGLHEGVILFGSTPGQIVYSLNWSCFSNGIVRSAQEVSSESLK